MTRAAASGRFRRLLPGPVSVMIATAGLVVLGSSTPAGAAPAALYAAPSALGSGDCLTAATACPLATALGDVAAGGSIELVTSGIEGTSATYYSGTFTVSTGGTSSSARVTIEPAAGVTDPILDGGSAGTVLTIDADVWADVDGVTIQDGVTDSGALGTPVGEVGANGGGIRNAGTMQLTNSTISDNRTGDGGNGRNGGIFAGGGGGGNGGAGAGIDNTGTLSLTNSTVTG
ncbi:MAG: hypothetical protein ACRDYB_12180, partial [Acidimicrobiales bacterium]